MENVHFKKVKGGGRMLSSYVLVDKSCIFEYISEKKSIRWSHKRKFS